MKNSIIYLLVVSLLFSYNSFEGYEYHEEKDNIEAILNERIEIMNDFLYGVKDMNVLKEKLTAIESGVLLDNDLDILYKVIDNPTDFELAVNVKIDKIKSLEKKDNMMYINADLKWLMSGYDGEFNLVRNYDIQCVKSDDDVYLTALKYME